jgi:hypothetical protein
MHAFFSILLKTRKDGELRSANQTALRHPSYSAFGGAAGILFVDQRGSVERQLVKTHPRRSTSH